MLHYIHSQAVYSKHIIVLERQPFKGLSISKAMYGV